SAREVQWWRDRMIKASEVGVILRSIRPLAFLCPRYRHHRRLPSFPTRRSSDLARPGRGADHVDRRDRGKPAGKGQRLDCEDTERDRKSTRLNSSHRTISYAVFCLKKKKSS